MTAIRAQVACVGRRARRAGGPIALNRVSTVERASDARLRGPKNGDSDACLEADTASPRRAMVEGRRGRPSGVVELDIERAAPGAVDRHRAAYRPAATCVSRASADAARRDDAAVRVGPNAVVRARAGIARSGELARDSGDCEITDSHRRRSGGEPGQFARSRRVRLSHACLRSRIAIDAVARD